MGQITLVLTEEAEKLLRSKNAKKGDMGKYVSKLIVTDLASTGESEAQVK